MPVVSPASAIASAAVADPTAPAPVVEGKPAPAVAPKPVQSETDRLARLAAAQKQSTTKTLALKQEQQKLEQLRQELDARAKSFEGEKGELEQYREWKKKAKASPLEVMKALGIEYDAATAQKLNGDKPTPEQLMQPLREEIESLKAQLAKDKDDGTKAQEEARKKAIKDAESGFEKECASYLESNAAELKLTKHFGGESLISNIVREHWAIEEKAAAREQRQPKMLSIAEAAKYAEKWYSDQLASASKLTAPAEPKPEVPAPQRPSSRSAIDSSMGSSASSGAGKKKLSISEHRAAVRAKFVGQQ